MWYVMQTMTGEEAELVQMIKTLVSPDSYKECFVAYYERVWRKQQESIIHVERLCPGYVFIISDTPWELYLELKRVPAMSKLIFAGEQGFLPLEKEEESFFQDLLANEKIVKLSYVETDGKGKVYRISGPLEKYTDRVLKYQFKKRYAIIRFKILGIEKTVALGIILREDVRQEIAYGKVEAPISTPEFYHIENLDSKQSLALGDHVKVISGTLENMSGVIWKIKKNTVEVGIRLFGQDMAMEVPINDICVTSYKED